FWQNRELLGAFFGNPGRVEFPAGAIDAAERFGSGVAHRLPSNWSRWTPIARFNAMSDSVNTGGAGHQKTAPLPPPPPPDGPNQRSVSSNASSSVIGGAACRQDRLGQEAPTVWQSGQLRPNRPLGRGSA